MSRRATGPEQQEQTMTRYTITGTDTEGTTRTYDAGVTEHLLSATLTGARTNDWTDLHVHEEA